MELKLFGYGALTILCLIVAVIWLAIKRGRAQQAEEYEKASQDTMIKVIKNSQSIDEKVKGMSNEELDSNL